MSTKDLSSPFNIDPELAEALAEGVLPGGEAIRLPFEVPYVQWINGDKRMAQLGGTAFYGGWDISEEYSGDAVKEIGDLPGWELVDRVSQSNSKTYKVWTTRSILFAPIASRTAFASIDDPAVLYPTMVPGTRTKMQVLGLLANRVDGEIQYWGPAVITLRSTKAGQFRGVMRDWEKHAGDSIAKIAPHLPPWVFWMEVGTFGKERNESMAGKGNQQSPVANIVLQTPELNEETLQELFVGQELMIEMLRFKREADEWLTAWSEEALNERTNAQEGPQSVQASVQAPTVSAYAKSAPVMSQPLTPPTSVTPEESETSFLVEEEPAQDNSDLPAMEIEEQLGIRIHEAEKITVPAGVVNQGTPLKKLLDNDHGVSVLKFLGGYAQGPGGQSFSGDARVTAAAQLLLHIAQKVG